MKTGSEGREVGTGYAFGQLAHAFTTAREHADAPTRERALTRMDQWAAVLRGMASGTLRVGSRAPVVDVPVWVTPQVIRGGFATGRPAGPGRLDEDELAIIQRAGLKSSRRALFEYLLSPPGLAELDTLLRSRDFEVRIPEEAALLTLVWLIRHGETRAAVDLANELAPFAGPLRFLARPAAAAAADPAIVSRETAGMARQTLAARREHERVATMRETLTVWNPFADELLTLWLQTIEGTALAAARPAGWTARSAALLERYATLSAQHRRATKHRKPKENLAILLHATREAVAGRELDPATRGRLQHAVDSMVAKRGRPGSPSHQALRATQAAIAAAPMHHTLALVAVGRLAALPQARGVTSVGELTAAVTAAEAVASGVPAGTPMPASVVRVVRRALEGTPEHLIAEGVIGSAEVLAELVPQIAATTVAAAYPDPDLQAIVAANYAAFRRRRSLLLVDYEHQVRVDELPWMRAVEPHRAATRDTVERSRAAVARLGELALTAFPATIIPSALVTELEALARDAGLALPFVEELAADIFMGGFTPKFLRAAQLAGELLEDSLYARYYDIDYRAIRALDDDERRGQRSEPTAAPFAVLCRARAAADDDGGYSVASNGTIIEQAQILTTHNLAVLTGPFGIGEAMRLDGPALASRCLDTVVDLAARLRGNPRPLRTIKDAAYAWRQMVFFLSALSQAQQEAFAADARGILAAARPDVRVRLEPAVAGLAYVVGGGSFDGHGRGGAGRRLLGWTTERHWMLGAARL